jgi:hypothetical protein
MAQEAVAAYELGIAGCARWSETPPIYQGGDSPSDHAWRVIGEILYWVHRGRFVQDTPELTPLWEQLEGDTLIAAGDVLYHLTNVGWRAREDALEGPNLVHRFPAQVRRIALAGLEHTGNVPSVFPHSSILYGGLAGFMLSSLGIVGVEADVSVLRRFVEDTNVGRIAVAAIERINGVRV